MRCACSSRWRGGCERPGPPGPAPCPREPLDSRLGALPRTERGLGRGWGLTPPPRGAGGRGDAGSVGQAACRAGAVLAKAPPPPSSSLCTAAQLYQIPAPAVAALVPAAGARARGWRGRAPSTWGQPGLLLCPRARPGVVGGSAPPRRGPSRPRSDCTRSLYVLTLCLDPAGPTLLCNAGGRGAEPPHTHTPTVPFFPGRDPPRPLRAQPPPGVPRGLAGPGSPGGTAGTPPCMHGVTAPSQSAAPGPRAPRYQRNRRLVLKLVFL